MKTMMTKTGLRFTASSTPAQVVLSAQVTSGGTYYQWLLDPKDVAKLAEMLERVVHESRMAAHRLDDLKHWR